MKVLCCNTYDSGGRAAIVVKCVHAGLLARGIAYILEDDERRARMGEAARKVVEERYAAPVIARQYMNLYEEILSQKSRVVQ